MGAERVFAGLCRHVIVTVPLGVLKKGSIAFSPPLPACNLASIGRLGMGLEDKVALVFKPDQIFWDKTNEVCGDPALVKQGRVAQAVHKIIYLAYQ